MPVKPNTAAMMAMMKNASAQLNMTDSFRMCGLQRYRGEQTPCPAGGRDARSEMCNVRRASVRTTCRKAASTVVILILGTPRHGSCCSSLNSEAGHMKLDDNLPLMTWRARPDMSCEHVSRAWLNFTGYAVEEALGEA